MKRIRPSTSARAQRGVMLLEVLIGLLIFMIGALGLIGYVGRAAADSVEARLRAEAALLSQQYFARLDSLISTSDRGANLATYTAAIGNVAPGLCQAWIDDTLHAPRTGLPNATASCEIVPTAESVHVRLTITWKARAGGSSDSLATRTHQFVTQRPIV
ncbi:MAG: hypothetical protein QM766_08945 [Burkholderiaceae bacterium]